MPNANFFLTFNNRQLLAHTTSNQFAFQAPALIRARTSKVFVNQAIDPALIIGQPAPPAPASAPQGAVSLGPDDVPHLAEQHGNWFTVPSNVNLKWYLPTYVLLDETDPAFRFDARQTMEIDETGNPFNTCTVTMTMRKVRPTDVLNWVNQNPGGMLREVPLEDLEGAIIVHSVNNGVPQSTRCAAKVTANDDGTFLVTADTILGVHVVSLYENLTLGNNATCSIAGQFKAWRVKPRPPLPPGAMTTMMLTFEVAPVPFEVTADVGRKYQADQYRLKYTIATTGDPKVIVNAEDLRGFDVHQTEFVELRALGDVALRFPSIDKLYLGVVSRTVVVVPARYVIQRESGVCDAQCTALVDSSPGLNAGCKFQLAFTLVPDVSSIDLLLLVNELNAHPDATLHGLPLQLPRAFDFASAVLATSFLTSSRYFEGGVDSHSIGLSCEIKEAAGGTPAVANANLFIAQLRSANEPFVTGAVNIRLDDAFPAPIGVPVVLNFTHTQANGPAGLALHADAATGRIAVANTSSFDLLVSRIAILGPAAVQVIPVGQVIAAAGSLPLDIVVPLAADQSGLSLLSDCELAVDASASKDNLFRLLQVRTVDVQNTQCLLSVNAAAVRFTARGIDQISIGIALSGTPEVSVATMVVRKERLFDSTRVLIPFAQAMVEVNAILTLDVTFGDAATPAVRFTLPNDFGQHPIFQLKDGDLPS